jgi:hypothetical protein
LEVNNKKGEEGGEDSSHCYCVDHGCECFIRSKAIIANEVVAKGAKMGFTREKY